jgi:hypothetical protein
MVDHQIAHVYVKRPERIDIVARTLKMKGVQRVLRPSAEGVCHRRAGDLILAAEAETWFDYRWWPQIGDGPAFAKTIDIHRKPGYDPLELFLEPGTRTITQDATLIRGSHGSVPESAGLLIGIGQSESLEMTSVSHQILDMLKA